MRTVRTKAATHDENRLRQSLQYLNLSSFLQDYDEVAKQAAKCQWSHVHYLEQLTEAEVRARRDRSIQRRIKLARLPALKTLDQFDWTWPKKLNRLHVQDLFRLNFLEQNANVIFLGGVGLGKTHLSIALAYRFLPFRVKKNSEGNLRRLQVDSEQSNCVKGVFLMAAPADSDADTSAPPAQRGPVCA